MRYFKYLELIYNLFQVYLNNYSTDLEKNKIYKLIELSLHPNFKLKNGTTGYKYSDGFTEFFISKMFL